MKRLLLFLVLILLCGARLRAADDPASLPVESVAPSEGTADTTQDAQPIADAAELFALVGVDRQVFDSFVDGQSITADQLSPLANVLFHLSRFPPGKVHHWSRRDMTSQQLIAEPAAHRGQLVQLAGRVKRVTAEKLPADLAERFEMPQIFRCRIDLADGGRAVVYCQAVPAAWKLDESIDQAADFRGVLLSVGPPGRAARPPELYFAGYNVAWYSSTLLGSLGMDFGLLDRVQQNQPIAAAEAEAFYQMLQAAGRAKLGDLLSATQGQQWTVVPASPDQDQLARELESHDPPRLPLLMSDPGKYVGQLMAFQGRLYRCVPVRITDRELAERLGFDTYYELAIFIDLGYRQRLRPAADAADDPNAAPEPKIVDNYPVFACVLRLPPGFPTGEKLNEVVRVPGFFFKLWSYSTRFAAPAGSQRREVSPLIIGPGVQWLSEDKPAETGLEMIAAVALAGLLTGVFVVLWLTRRRDEQFRREVLNRRLDSQAEVKLELPAGEGPT